MKKFPEGFYWGAATSSFQVEGGIENMDWAKAAREGRVPPIGDACDHYNRYEEDFDIAKSLGHNCHRLSIEWARIEPEEGKFDEKEIEHYRDVLKALRARGMEPFVTLWHFTLPLWFSESGGFERKDAPEVFAQYCAYVVSKMGDLCTHYSTINEALPYTSNGWRRGTWPPFKKWPLIDRVNLPKYDNPFSSRAAMQWGNILAYFRVLRALARSHNAAYDAMKHTRPDAQIGIVHHVVLFEANWNPVNKLIAFVSNWHWTHNFMGKVAEKCDVIGLNYYLYKKFGDRRVYEKTDMGWDSYPEGICNALLMLKRYGKPIYVSEAGIADEADRMRAEYIKSLIRCMRSAIGNGIDLRGYMYWSLLDNYELAYGYTKHFGLIAVDVATQKRTVRPSAYVYKEIIERNGLVE